MELEPQDNFMQEKLQISLEQILTVKTSLRRDAVEILIRVGRPSAMNRLCSIVSALQVLTLSPSTGARKFGEPGTCAS